MSVRYGECSKQGIWFEKMEEADMIRNVLEYLEHTAAAAGEAGVTDETGFCSYRKLLEKSMCIGSALCSLTAPNRPIPVLMDKGIEALAAFLGIVQAGCCYTLLNPDLPDSRLRQVLDVLRSDYLLTDSGHRERAESLFPAERIRFVRELQQAPQDQKTLESIRSRMIDTDPLYINFTSGSTGVPKGVVISHRSVIDFMEVFPELFRITDADILANQAPFDFDVSVKDIYSALKTGANLVIVPKQLFSQPVKLLDFLCDHRVTTMIWAVSALCLITTVHGLDYRTPETVTKVLFSGEVMPLKHLKTWMEHLPEAEFVNLYGPTEITCNCTYHVMERGRCYDAGIPIGRAFPNERVFLLDEQDRLVTQVNCPGELCVSGSAVGLGYFSADEQTREKFPQNPLNIWYSERIYRTGDLACRNEQGELMFRGRRDFQIKYRGHRIELEEIERAMAQVEGIDRACCIYEEEKNRLYGFYVGTPDSRTLYQKLTQLLPVYMIPGKLTRCDSLPLTKNGKTDRAALKKELRQENK